MYIGRKLLFFLWWSLSWTQGSEVVGGTAFSSLFFSSLYFYPLNIFPSLLDAPFLSRATPTLISSGQFISKVYLRGCLWLLLMLMYHHFILTFDQLILFRVLFMRERGERYQGAQLWKLHYKIWESSHTCPLDTNHTMWLCVPMTAEMNCRQRVDGSSTRQKQLRTRRLGDYAAIQLHTYFYPSGMWRHM